MDANNGTDTTSTTTTTTPVTPAAPAGPSKAELRAAELKAKREAKAAEKEARKAELAEKRAGGIIGTLKAALDTPNGTSRKEILAALTAKFPDRDPVGMSVTVGIQLSRLAKTTGRKIVSAKVEGRDRVYGFADTVVFPPITVDGTPVNPGTVPAVLEGSTTPGEAELVAAIETLKAEAGSVAQVDVAKIENAVADELTAEPTPAKGKGKGKGKGGKGK